MNTDLRIVTDQVFLLGLDELYRDAMKRHESTELLNCALEVVSTLGIEPADVPIEGYYTETPELTNYFQLVRSLQGQPRSRQYEVQSLPAFKRLVEVTSSPLFGTPSDGNSLLPSATDPLTIALDKAFPNWNIETITDTAYNVSLSSDDYSLVGLAALSRDPVVLTALRESVVLYATVFLGAAWSDPEYAWEVATVIEERACKFVETFNRLFEDNIPVPCSENAEQFWDACDHSKVTGRCVRIGIDDSVHPVRHYHWAISYNEKHEHQAVDFWDEEIWTTHRYRETHMDWL